MPCMWNAQTRAARRVSHVPAPVYFFRREQIVHGRKACEREERKRTKCRPLETLFCSAAGQKTSQHSCVYIQNPGAAVHTSGLPFRAGLEAAVIALFALPTPPPIRHGLCRMASSCPAAPPVSNAVRVAAISCLLFYLAASGLRCVFSRGFCVFGGVCR